MWIKYGITTYITTQTAELSTLISICTHVHTKVNNHVSIFIVNMLNVVMGKLSWTTKLR